MSETFTCYAQKERKIIIVFKWLRQKYAFATRKGMQNITFTLLLLFFWRPVPAACPRLRFSVAYLKGTQCPKFSFAMRQRNLEITKYYGLQNTKCSVRRVAYPKENCVRNCISLRAREYKI